MYDHELLREIMDEHGLALKQVALASKLSTQSVHGYRYDNGPNPPLQLWAALFRLTQDMRIPQAILENSGWHATQLAGVILNDLPHGLSACSHMLRETVRIVDLLLEVFEDGKVTSNEAPQIAEFVKHSNRMIAGLLAVQSRLKIELDSARRESAKSA